MSIIKSVSSYDYLVLINCNYIVFNKRIYLSFYIL